MTNLKKDVIDKRLVNSVKYLYLSLRLVWSLFTCKRVWKQMWKQAQGTKKVVEGQTCMTDLASYLLTQRQFLQLTLKWLPGARAQDKNKQYYCCFLFFSDFYSVMRFKENPIGNLRWVPLRAAIPYNLFCHLEKCFRGRKWQVYNFFEKKIDFSSSDLR